MRVGEQVAGRFVVTAYAGAGGMGEVFRARDDQGEGDVALEVMRREIGDRGAKRFEREAQVLASLRHPAIVRYVTHGAMAAERERDACVARWELDPGHVELVVAELERLLA